jgi:hypothetical protein
VPVFWPRVGPGRRAAATTCPQTNGVALRGVAAFEMVSHGAIQHVGSGFDRARVGIGHPASASREARDQMFISKGQMPPRFTSLHGLVMEHGQEQLLVQELQRIAMHEGAGALCQLLAQEDEGGCTPLMRAAHQGSVANVRALLAAGADASASSTRTRRTALHEAACSVHDNPYVSGLLLGAGCDPEQTALVNGRTCLDIAKLKIGPDGRLGSSAIGAQLLPLVRENSSQKVERGHIRVYEGEVKALLYICGLVGVAHGLEKHAELMAAVREYGLDLCGTIQAEGVQQAVETAMSYGQQLTQTRLMETAPSHGEGVALHTNMPMHPTNTTKAQHSHLRFAATKSCAVSSCVNARTWYENLRTWQRPRDIQRRWARGNDCDFW